MIGQYLSNTNESATVYILQNFLEVNKARMNLRFSDHCPTLIVGYGIVLAASLKYLLVTCFSSESLLSCLLCVVLA